MSSLSLLINLRYILWKYIVISILFYILSHHDLSQDEHNNIGGLAAGDGIEKL